MASHFNLIRQKNKFLLLSPVFLNAVFQDDISIEGKFNGVDVSVEMKKFDELTIDKKDDYIASYKLTSKVNENDILNNLVHTYMHESMIRTSDQVSHLCSSSFKSPYFMILMTQSMIIIEVWR